MYKTESSRVVCLCIHQIVCNASGNTYVQRESEYIGEKRNIFLCVFRILAVLSTLALKTLYSLSFDSG